VNGPGHYAEAERLMACAMQGAADLVAEAEKQPGDIDMLLSSGQRNIANFIGLANVHATLALAAATAQSTIDRLIGDDNLDDARAWADATAPSAVSS
jgi:hypothetical protein